MAENNPNQKSDSAPKDQGHDHGHSNNKWGFGSLLTLIVELALAGEIASEHWYKPWFKLLLVVIVLTFAGMFYVNFRKLTKCNQTTAMLVAIIISLAASIALVVSYIGHKPPFQDSNLLVPGKEPDPPEMAEMVDRIVGVNPIPGEQSPLKFFLGPNAGFTRLNTQKIISIAGQDLLTIHRAPGGISMDAKVFGADGAIVAQIDSNKFFINQNAAFRIDRPNAHSLIVYDNRDEKVLDVSYLNASSVRINGVFRYGDAHPAVITDTTFVAGDIGFSKCVFLEAPFASLIELDAKGGRIR